MGGYLEKAILWEITPPSKSNDGSMAKRFQGQMCHEALLTFQKRHIT